MKITTIAACLLAVSCAHRVHAQTSPFPTSLDTDATLKVLVNGVSTQLTSSMTTATTTLSVSACAGIVANVLITIDQEIMPVSGCTGTVLVVGSRGFNGTTAATHASATPIYAYITAWNVNAADSAIKAIEGALGANLVNVVTGNSSPTLNSLTVSGAGGVISTSSSGYAFNASQPGAQGGYFATLSGGSLFTGSTTASSMMHLTDSGGACTISAAAGAVCTGTQDTRTSASPAFAGLNIVGSQAVQLVNYIGTETGSNNAIAGTLTNAPTLVTGLEVTVSLASHTLQAGSNTFNYAGGGALSIKSHFNPANNIGTAYALASFVTLRFNGSVWLDMAQ